MAEAQSCTHDGYIGLSKQLLPRDAILRDSHGGGLHGSHDQGAVEARRAAQDCICSGGMALEHTFLGLGTVTNSGQAKMYRLEVRVRVRPVWGEVAERDAYVSTYQKSHCIGRHQETVIVRHWPSICAGDSRSITGRVKLFSDSSRHKRCS